MLVVCGLRVGSVLGAVGLNGYVFNCAGQARFTSAVQFIGTDSAISLNNGSKLTFNKNGSTRRYTPDATEGLSMAHNNFVAVSAGDVSNASNQYFMCDGLVNKTIFHNPVDVLCKIFIRMLMLIVIILILLAMVNYTSCELYRYVNAFSSFDMRNSVANSSIRFVCGDPAVQSNIVGAVNTFMLKLVER